MARRATSAEIIAAVRVMHRPAEQAVVTAEALAAVVADVEANRRDDYEEFDWREQRNEQV